MSRIGGVALLAAVIVGCRAASANSADTAMAEHPHALTVRVLDVGQGDATYITNGGSRVIIDGGPDARRFGHLLDSLGVHDDTIDVVVLSHAHFDHYSGLRELFRTSRHIVVRYFFENQDPSAASSLRQLRDSIAGVWPTDRSSTAIRTIRAATAGRCARSRCAAVR
ncbi:MAG TPA: MBL fold metallo-hydrolase [Gemmatimonadaceae bacterium]